MKIEVKYRSLHKLIADLLSSVPATKSRLYYRVGLSYKRINYYLLFCLDVGLITFQSKIFVITEKGRRYLALFTELEKLLEEAKP